MPTERAIGAPLSGTAEDWEPDRKDARLHYAPRDATGFARHPHQIARFKRGDRTLVATAWRLMREQRMGPAPYQEGLFVANDAVRRTSREVLNDAPANGAVVTSLEVSAPSANRAARERTSVQPLPPGPRLSDMLLLAAGDVGATPSLESVAKRAWSSNDGESLLTVTLRRANAVDSTS